MKTGKDIKETKKILESSKPISNLDANVDSELVNYIDHEIDYIKGEIQQPGWTIWALLGGLATLSWLLLEEIGKQQFNTDNILMLFLLFIYVGMDFFVPMYRIFGIQDKEKKHFFTPLSESNFFSLKRTIFLVCTDIAVIYITYLLSLRIGTAISLLSYICRGALIFLTLIKPLVIRFARQFNILTAVPNRPGPMFSGCMLIPTSAISVYLAFFYSFYLVNNHILISLEEYRITGLIIAIFVLLIMLINANSKTPLLVSLVEIRREYVMGKADYFTAKKRLEIALLGLDISSYFQGKISNILSLVNKADSQLSEALNKINILKNIYKKNDTKNFEEDRAIADSLNQAIFNHFLQYRNIMRVQISKDESRFKGEVMASKFYGTDGGLLVGIEEKIDHSLNESKIRYRETIKAWQAEIGKYENAEIIEAWNQRVEKELKLKDRAQ